MPVIIDSQNFKKVVAQFNYAGELVNKQARIQIDCVICREKLLGITNPSLSQLNDNEHERYAVLPLCGHAFGYDCLRNWLNTGSRECPLCRTPTECGKYHKLDLTICGIKGDATSQASDIRKIRQALQGCHKCLYPPAKQKAALVQQQERFEEAQGRADLQERLEAMSQGWQNPY
ncbi:hypothetical protein NPX13_g275 [Xylaria arbuscula]|uniref:RING-type domain-containing protein n=1 Tax=Xylaria arbuscula TaxID=114810 RepID=A0A9W8NN67_9PEZI|nr:hypothetical protein NPX13_g275 [Xylaria arbuscula]